MGVVRSNLRSCLKKVAQRIVECLILFTLILLGILLSIPKAQSQDPIGLRMRNQHDLVGKAVLFIRNRQCFFIDEGS
jgi:hypothetical protein